MRVRYGRLVQESGWGRAADVLAADSDPAEESSRTEPQMTWKATGSAVAACDDMWRRRKQPSSFTPLVLLAVSVAMLASACASRNTPPRFPGAIRPPKEHSPSPGGVLVAATALRLQGTPYRNGGSDMSGFDCSGLVQYAFGQHGVVLPRSVRDQFQAGLAVPRTTLIPGDLVFFATTSTAPSHVGIVVGDDTFVHAPSGRGAVRVEHLSAEYWNRRYLGARRVLLP